MKIALLGGGGFRTPLAYAAMASVAPRISPADIVLYDGAAERLRHMQLILQGVADETGQRLPVRVSTDLDDAVDGADFVWCAIRVGGLEGRLNDEQVPVRHGVLGQETTGPGGICFALRSLPALMRIATTVARRAPRTWFINFTNPVGLVTEALQQVLGSRVIGVCDTPSDLCTRVARLVGRPPDQLRFEYFGLNHLGWLRTVDDGGGDLLQRVIDDDVMLDALAEARLFGTARIRELRMIPNEYLFYYEHPDTAVEAVRHGRGRAAYLIEQQRAFYAERFSTPAEAVATWRAAWRERNRTYMAEAVTDRETTESAGSNGYAEIAAQLVEALACNTRRVMILNTANRGSLPAFEAQTVVEVPCVVGAAGPAPLAMGDIPLAARELMHTIKRVERLTISAALNNSAVDAVSALAEHPLVPSRQVAERIFHDYRQADPELRARFGAA